MVFVLDKNQEPLMPCTPKRARILLDRGRAAVFLLRPFTIILKDRLAENSILQPLALKLDLGSKAAVAAIARELPSEAPGGGKSRGGLASGDRARGPVDRQEAPAK